MGPGAKLQQKPNIGLVSGLFSAHRLSDDPLVLGLERFAIVDSITSTFWLLAAARIPCYRSETIVERSANTMYKIPMNYTYHTIRNFIKSEMALNVISDPHVRGQTEDALNLIINFLKLDDILTIESVEPFSGFTIRAAQSTDSGKPKNPISFDDFLKAAQKLQISLNPYITRPNS